MGLSECRVLYDYTPMKPIMRVAKEGSKYPDMAN